MACVVCNCVDGLPFSVCTISQCESDTRRDIPWLQDRNECNFAARHARPDLGPPRMVESGDDSPGVHPRFHAMVRLGTSSVTPLVSTADREPAVLYYAHKGSPTKVRHMAASFTEWAESIRKWWPSNEYAQRGRESLLWCGPHIGLDKESRPLCSCPTPLFVPGAATGMTSGTDGWPPLLFQRRRAATRGRRPTTGC